MMRLLPGDRLWDRYRVERVADNGLDGAWLSALFSESPGSADTSFLLIDLQSASRQALAALLTAASTAPQWHAPAVSSERRRSGRRRTQAGSAKLAASGARELPLLGPVEWVGTAGRERIAILAAPPAQSLLALLRRTGPLTPAQALPLLRALLEGLGAWLALWPRGPAPQDLLRALARLLQPEGLALQRQSARLSVLAALPPAGADLAPPPWTEFLAPEIFRNETLTPGAWVFSVSQIAAFCLGVGQKRERGSPEAAWADLAAWSSGQRDPARELLASPEAAAWPPDWRHLLAHGLAKDAADRPGPARMLTLLNELRGAIGALADRRCDRCGFVLVRNAACPCCDAGAATADSAPAGASGSRTGVTVVRTRKSGGTTVLATKVAVSQPAASLPLPQGMTLIPGGMFLSGERKVPRSLRTFAIDTTPVTEAAYKQFLSVTGKTARPGGPGSLSAKSDQLPVTHITWHEANEYAEHFEKRLPTIYEWEKASRGIDGRKFPFGSAFKTGCGRLRSDREAKASAKDAPGPAVVGSFKSGASPFGVLDMAGNVLEWTSSARRAGDRLFRAVKGACFMDGSMELARCTSLQYLPPETAEPYVGFRCVKDVE